MAQEILDDAAYAGEESLRAAWRAAQGTETAEVGAVDGRPTIKLPCSFHARPQAALQQWERAISLDLSKADRVGVGLDVYCPADLPVQAFELGIGDGVHWSTAAIARTDLHPGWNIVCIRKSQMQAERNEPADWSHLRSLRLTARRGEAVNTVLHVADLRVLAADTMCTLPRPTLVDRLTQKDGQVIEGTVLNDLYAITTPYGQFMLPAERVVGLQSVGQGTVRVVLTDSQVVNGLMANRQVRISDAAGKVHEVNIHDIALLAYRLSAARPESCEPAAPMLVLGENRLAFDGDKLPLTLKTPHGSVNLPGRSLLCVEREPNSPPAAVPPFCVRFNRGSELTGTLAGDMFEVHLTALEPAKTCAVEVRQLVRITWPGRPHTPAGSVIITLRDGRHVVGRVAADSLTVKTSFGPETIGWSNVQSLTTGRVDPMQVNLKIWGRDAVEGRLVDETINFALAEGPVIHIQTAAVASVKAPQAEAQTVGSAK
jgi:hypothetical protein